MEEAMMRAQTRRNGDMSFRDRVMGFPVGTKRSRPENPGGKR